MPRFLAASQPVWKELEDMLDELEQAPDTQLDLARSERFFRLYQRTSVHLAEVRHLTAERELRGYLEHLVARAYARIYVRGQGRSRSVWRWFTEQFPIAVRRQARALALSVAVFLAGSAFGALALRFDPAAKMALMPFSHLKGKPSDRVKKEMADRGKHLEGGQARFSAQLMTHNTRVSFLTLGLGMTFGLGTIVLLFYNGVILGSVALDYVADGQSVFLMGWLLPHGSVEIPAILLAGQAGLVIGNALVGWRTREPRRLRLRRILPDIVTIAGGISVLLIWAGLIESFFSQYHEPVVPYAAKIGFGLVQFAALAVFLMRGGRSVENESSL